MSPRKTPAQRVEEYRSRAQQIEERERRKLLGQSPSWMATKRAIANIELAIQCLPEGESDSGLRDALELAQHELVGTRKDEID